MPDTQGYNQQSTKKDGEPNAERIKGYSSEKEAYKRLRQKEAKDASPQTKRTKDGK